MKRVIVFFTLVLLAFVIASPLAISGTSDMTASAYERKAGDADRAYHGRTTSDSRVRAGGESLFSLFGRFMLFDLPGLRFHFIDTRPPDRNGPVTVQTPPGTLKFKTFVGPDKDDWGWSDVE